MTRVTGIPSLQDINVYDSLDERCAVKNFLGKNLEEAEAMFREGGFRYCEDLMWMGPRGFCYYIRAFFSYLKSEDSTGESECANAYCSLLWWRLDINDPKEIESVMPELLASVLYLTEHFDKFADPQCYADLPEQLSHWKTVP